MANNGKSISISTLVCTKWNGGDLYETISQLLERRPTGVMTLHLSQGGINGVEWVEKINGNQSHISLDKFISTKVG